MTLIYEDPPEDLAEQLASMTFALVRDAMAVIVPGADCYRGYPQGRSDDRPAVCVWTDGSDSAPVEYHDTLEFAETIDLKICVEAPSLEEGWDRRARAVGHEIRKALFRDLVWTGLFKDGPAHSLTLNVVDGGGYYHQSAMLAFTCQLLRPASFSPVFDETARPEARRDSIRQVDWSMDLRSPEDPAEREDRPEPGGGYIAPRAGDGKTELSMQQTRDSGA